LEFGHAQVNLASPQGKRLFYTAIRDAYSRLHPQRWARLNGRVLVWLWVEEGLGPYTPRGSLRPTFDYAKSRFAADFGGCRLIFIGSPGWRSQYNAPIDLTYEWGAARHSPGVITRNNPIVQIGPGFNYRGHTDTYADRQNGQRYWDGWVVALNSGRRIIAIETWNEFHEATEVCPSSEYEWFYWLITRRFAALHHRNPLPAPAYNPANGHCYEVVPIHINWFDADRLARTCVYQGRRGHLVTITSPEEQDFVLRTLGGPVALNEYWLGGFQGGGPEPAGGWQWVTREPWNYTCWFPGNPDDWMGAEHWVQFFGNTGLWNDIPALHIGRGLLVEYE
jgi:hypothetical protein